MRSVVVRFLVWAVLAMAWGAVSSRAASYDLSGSHTRWWDAANVGGTPGECIVRDVWGSTVLNLTITNDEPLSGSVRRATYTWSRTMTGNIGFHWVYLYKELLNGTPVQTVLNGFADNNDSGGGTVDYNTSTERLRIVLGHQKKSGCAGYEEGTLNQVYSFIQPAPFFHHIRFTNSSAVPVKYDVIRTGTGGVVTLETVTVPAQTYGTLIKTYQFSEGDTFNVVPSLNDYVYQDGAWLSLPGAITSFNAVDGTGDTYTSAELAAMSGSGAASSGVKLTPIVGTSPPAPPAPTATNTIPINTPSHLPTHVPTAGAGSTWPTNTANTTDSERLDKSTYRQGVDKLDARIKESITEQKKTNEELAKLTELAELTTATKLQGVEATTASATQRATAKTEAEALFGSVPSAPSSSSSAGSAPSFAFTIGGRAVNVNPFTSERFLVAVEWFRQALAWVTLVLLGRWVWQQMGEWIRGFSTVQQAKGNTVVAGTGGQATSLIAAGIITVIIVTGTTGLIGWAFGDITLPSIATAVSANPFTDMSSSMPGAYWVLNKVFPVGLMVTALLARVTFNIYASTIFSGVMAAIRFVVP